jgi:hypothetical protein
MVGPPAAESRQRRHHQRIDSPDGEEGDERRQGESI